MHKIKLPPPKQRKYILISLVIVVAILSTLIVFTSRNKASVENSGPKTISDNFSEQNERELADKNYTKYQLGVLLVVDAAIEDKDYKNAEKMLNEILANVPESKILPETYGSLNALYKANGNNRLFRKYTEKLIVLLKKNGDSGQVKWYQDQLNAVSK